jgi:uncharacterized protein YqeY
MSLIDRISEDIKKAMLAREKQKLESLRSIKAALIVAKTEKGAAEVLSEDTELKLLQKLVKQREEAAEIYKQAGRDELYQNEMSERGYIMAYLPAALDENTIVEEIKKIIAETGASSAADFGKVMGLAVKKFAGKADNKFVSQKIRELLS